MKGKKLPIKIISHLAAFMFFLGCGDATTADRKLNEGNSNRAANNGTKAEKSTSDSKKNVDKADTLAKFVGKWANDCYYNLDVKRSYQSTLEIFSTGVIHSDQKYYSNKDCSGSGTPGGPTTKYDIKLEQSFTSNPEICSQEGNSFEPFCSTSNFYFKKQPEMIVEAGEGEIVYKRIK